MSVVIIIKAGKGDPAGGLKYQTVGWRACTALAISNKLKFRLRLGRVLRTSSVTNREVAGPSCGWVSGKAEPL